MAVISSNSAGFVRIGFWVIILLLVAALFLVVLYPAWQDPVAFFNNRRSQTTKVSVDSIWHSEGLTLQSLRIRGTDTSFWGTRTVEFDAYLCYADNFEQPQPAFILLGGLITGRDAIRYIAERPEVARRGIFLTLDYPYQGPTYFKGLEILPYLSRIRQALFNGVEAIRLALDYLEVRSEVDPRRIILLGVSLGAFFAVDAAAVDPRPAAVVAFMGGGQLGPLIAWNLRRGSYFPSHILALPVASLAALLIRPLEPTRLVGKIAPRPYIQISARSDALIPAANAVVLFEAAREPRSITWIPAPHLQPGMEKLIEQLINIADLELGKWNLL